MSPLPSPKGTPWAIAHRGWSAEWPENTLPAFEAALGLPIDAVELDLRLSADGVPIVFHDQTLAVTGHPGLRPVDLPLSRLRSLAVGACRGVIPLLDEVLLHCARRCTLLLEIKADPGCGGPDQWRDLALATLDSVRRYRVEDRVCILCYDLDLLAWVCRQGSHIPLVLNQDIGSVVPHADFIAAYSCRHTGITGPFTAEVSSLGKPVLAFTCNSRETIRRAVDLGATGVMSDHLDLLMETLAPNSPPE